MKTLKATAKKPYGNQHTFYCPYDKNDLLFLYTEQNIHIGIGLDRYLWCNKCKSQFIIGTRGFEQTEMNNINIKEEKPK